MKILLSPAKSLDYESQLPTDQYTLPAFQKEALKLNNSLKKMSIKEVSELMHISNQLARLNVERYKSYSIEFTTENARQAVFAFAGDVYIGLDAYTLPVHLHDALQENVRIFSGMYGYLKPLDLLQPYRLEMGTNLAIDGHKNLYQFWKDKITLSLNKQINDDELIVNLASKEYFKAVNKRELKGNLISPIFKDYKNGKLKVISFFAKKARGMMTRFLVESNAKTLEDVLSFRKDNYQYSVKDTIDEREPVFVR